jgi:hypothetical protein
MALEIVSQDSGPQGQPTRIVRDSTTGQHYWLSQVEGECLAFECDLDPTDEWGVLVTDWSQVAGTQCGGQTLDDTQAELEQRIAAGTASSDILLQEHIDREGIEGLTRRLSGEIAARLGWDA